MWRGHGARMAVFFPDVGFLPKHGQSSPCPRYGFDERFLRKLGAEGAVPGFTRKVSCGFAATLCSLLPSSSFIAPSRRRRSAHWDSYIKVRRLPDKESRREFSGRLLSFMHVVAGLAVGCGFHGFSGTGFTFVELFQRSDEGFALLLP